MRYIDFMIMTWFAVDSIHHYIHAVNACELKFRLMHSVLTDDTVSESLL